MQLAPSTFAFEPGASLRQSATLEATPPTFSAPAVRVQAPVFAPEPMGLEERPPSIAPLLDAPDLRPNPYPDYVREFTADGGIRITYKDLDERFKLKAAKFAMWLVATAATAAFCYLERPLPGDWNVGGPILMSVIYAWLARGPIEIYRSIEIRPDCMILDDEDVFWLSMMEFLPYFREDEALNKVLCGGYGTRYVEFLTVRAFDPQDITPLVLEQHLKAAMEQQWLGPGG